MGVTVAGADDLAISLRAAAEDLVDADLRPVALEAATVMAGFIPVRTGRARDTITVARVAGLPQVVAGGPRAPYVPILRNRHPSRFVERTDAVMETRAPRHLETEWDTIAERHGLA